MWFLRMNIFTPNTLTLEPLDKDLCPDSGLILQTPTTVKFMSIDFTGGSKKKKEMEGVQPLITNILCLSVPGKELLP